MEWFTFLVYGIVPIIIFYSIGIFVLRLIFKLLIDSWQKEAYNFSNIDHDFKVKKHNW